MRQFAAIGEAMIELSPQAERSFAMGFAGDTLNLSTYLARQTTHTQVAVNYVTALGEDPYSEMMLNDWKQERINTELVIQLPSKLPGLYLIRNDAKGERSLYFYRSQSAARELFKSNRIEDVCAKLIHMNFLFFSCITLAIYDEPSRERLLALLIAAKKQGATIIFDSNYRPALWPDLATTQRVIGQFAAQVDIALPTFTDEQKMFNDATPQVCAQRLHQWGIKEVVVKCDREPCLISTSDGQQLVSAETVSNVIDSTGAGDSFNAGYLAARFKNYSPADAARYGHKLAATVIQHRGAIIPPDKMPKLFG